MYYPSPRKVHQATRTCPVEKKQSSQALLRAIKKRKNTVVHVFFKLKLLLDFKVNYDQGLSSLPCSCFKCRCVTTLTMAVRETKDKVVMVLTWLPIMW